MLLREAVLVFVRHGLIEVVEAHVYHLAIVAIGVQGSAVSEIANFLVEDSELCASHVHRLRNGVLQRPITRQAFAQEVHVYLILIVVSVNHHWALVVIHAASGAVS